MVGSDNRLGNVKGDTMTLKNKITAYFQEHLFQDENGLYSNNDFYSVCDKVSDGIEMGGIQWFFEWRDDAPPLTESRSEFIKNGIEKFVLKLKPEFTGII